MPFWKRPAIACAVLSTVLFAARGSATTCVTDYDCTCGQVCNYDVPGAASGLCVQADQSEGHCTGTEGPLGNGCLYEGQTCAASSAFCTPGWSQSSVCDQTMMGTTGTSTSGTSGTGTVGSATAGGGASSTGGSSTGGSSTGGSSSGGAAGTTTGGATAGSTTGSNQMSTTCGSDLDCPCGDICASGYHSGGKDGLTANTCISADGGQIGDFGLCALVDAGGTIEGRCHYSGQTCEFNIPITNIPGDFPPYCSPSSSLASVCLGDGGTSPSKSNGCATGVSGGTPLVLALAALGLWAARRRMRR